MSGEVVLEDLTLVYDRHPAVHHVSGRFVAGSLTAIVGPNGAGKTTLLRALAGLHPVASGRIAGAGPGRVAMLPQGSALDRSFPVGCVEVVGLGAWGRCGAWRPLGRGDRARAVSALVAVGLGGFERRPVATLSAGQFQRLLFARLMMTDAPVLLLDEPFNAVDARTAAELASVVEGWHEAGRTVVLVSHDLAMVRERMPQTLLLARHVVGWGPTAEVLEEGAMRRARLAAEAWSETAPLCKAVA